MWLLKPLLALLVLFAMAVATAIALAGAPLLDTPGLLPRLTTYLTDNAVSTQSIAAFPERELTRYRRPPAVVLEAAEAVARAEGWQVVSVDREAQTLHAVAATPVWGFRDDVRVRVTLTDDGASALHIRSSSRTGAADFGANTARLIRLRRGIEDRL